MANGTGKALDPRKKSLAADRFERKLALLARKDRVVVFAGSLPGHVEIGRYDHGRAVSWPDA